MYFTSKYCFFTIGLFSRINPLKSQVAVNIWHGMPIKVIGYDYAGSRHVPNFTYTISTSCFFQKIIANSFNVNENKVLNTGLPRNDLLFNNTSNLKDILGFRKYNKIIYWLPTYRDLKYNEQETKNHGLAGITGLDDLDLKELSEFLLKENILCVFKPHPLSNFVEERGNGSIDNILVINNDWMNERGTSLYEMLSITDILITDISSVYVDFLLRDKPIIFSFPDKDEYLKTRGTYFDDLDSALAGPIVTTMSDMIKHINLILNGSDFYKEKRKKMLSQFHDGKVEACYTENLIKALAAVK